MMAYVQAFILTWTVKGVLCSVRVDSDCFGFFFIFESLVSVDVVVWFFFFQQALRSWLTNQKIAPPILYCLVSIWISSSNLLSNP